MESQKNLDQKLSLSKNIRTTEITVVNRNKYEKKFLETASR